MEVFAGFMAHTDAQVERVIDYLVDQDAFDNTLVIYLTGDNGASAEGTVHGLERAVFPKRCARRSRVVA